MRVEYALTQYQHYYRYEIIMRLIGQVCNGTMFNRVIEHKNRNFKLRYDNKRNVPLGFDKRFRVEVLKDNKWETVGGKDKVRFEEIYHGKSHEEREQDADKFFDLMTNYIIKYL